MSAINFPLSTDISSAANQVSSQNAEQLPAGGSGQSTVLRPDTVTLSAVFPPAPPVDAANFVQFQSPAQPRLKLFRQLWLKPRARRYRSRPCRMQRQYLRQRLASVSRSNWRSWIGCSSGL